MTLLWSLLLLALGISLLVPRGGGDQVKASLAVSKRPELYVATLDGTLHCIYQDTGEVKWQHQDDPVLSVSRDVSQGPYFLPDPTDGSLYALRGNSETLEKLPFSIPELVHASPCHSSDNTLYIGRKSDVWSAIDLNTGKHYQTLTASGRDAKCPMTAEKPHFYLGRVEYTVSVYDGQTREQKWNATYYDYTTGPAVQDQPQFVPLVSSADGSLAVVDAVAGRTLWHQDLSSPVMAVYVWSSQDGLRPMPHRRLSKEMLHAAVGARNGKFVESALAGPDLSQVLFVGTQKNGSMYAYTTWAQEAQLRQPAVPLIPALSSEAEDGERQTHMTRTSHGAGGGGGASDGGVGAYPDTYRYMQLPLQSAFPLLRTSADARRAPLSLVNPQPRMTTAQGQPPPGGAAAARDVVSEANASGARPADSHLMDSLFTVLVSVLVAVVVVNLMQRKAPVAATTTHPSAATGHPARACAATSSSAVAGSGSGSVLSQDSVESASTHSTDSRNSLLNPAAAVHDTGDEDSLRSLHIVGKISFRAMDIIGRGSEGTCVFRGKFENREVAVKRVLREGYQLVMKEVELLRDGRADDHANVIRYYCTEANDTFYFIALELCQASLKEYVDDPSRFEKLPVELVMQQMLSGLAYLHSLSIVHRDIKPQNVLISYPKFNNELRALLSDFGLCKRLADGRSSFTARSGVTGTEGWIAPELMSGTTDTATCAVDIFSAGCLIFYVLCKGAHPFGPALHRQTNICTDKAPDFSALDECRSCDSVVLARDLVSRMISRYPNVRPPAREALFHPVFWSRRRQMRFIQEVSDRIEKELATSPIVMQLEQNAKKVVSEDWTSVLDPALRAEMMKFRTYQGGSVRTLLRYIRNKKHHYHEMDEKLRETLGALPDGFVEYFTTRFPQLLLHTYKAMSICQDEPVFTDYYRDGQSNS